MNRTVTKIITGIDTNSALRIPYSYSLLDCGHSIKTRAVGEQAECKSCDDYQTALAQLAELLPTIHHTRFREWCGVGLIHCYRRDTTSPSGFLLAMSIEARPEAEALLQGRLSPLSPTEGL